MTDTPTTADPDLVPDRLVPEPDPDDLELEVDPLDDADAELRAELEERAARAPYYVNVLAVTSSQMAAIERHLGSDYFAAVYGLSSGIPSRKGMEAVVRAGRFLCGGEAREALKLGDDSTLEQLVDRFNLCRFGFEDEEEATGTDPR